MCITSKSRNKKISHIFRLFFGEVAALHGHPNVDLPAGDRGGDLQGGGGGGIGQF